MRHGERFARLKLITGNPKLKTAVLHHKYQTKVQFRTDKKTVNKSDIHGSQKLMVKQQQGKEVTLMYNQIETTVQELTGSRILACHCVQVNPRKEKPLKGIENVSNRCAHVEVSSSWPRICTCNPRRHCHRFVGQWLLGWCPRSPR